MVETHFTLWHNTCETRPVCFVSSLWKLNLLYYQVNCQLNQAENNLLARFGQVKKARSRELSEPPEQPINLWVNLQEKLNLLAGFGQFKGAGSNSGRCFTLREKDNFDLIRQEFFSDHRLLSRRSKACSSSRTQHLDLFLCSQSVMVPRLFISEVARFVRTGSSSNYNPRLVRHRCIRSAKWIRSSRQKPPTFHRERALERRILFQRISWWEKGKGKNWRWTNVREKFLS